jgi:hypothetical protein
MMARAVGTWWHGVHGRDVEVITACGGRDGTGSAVGDGPNHILGDVVDSDAALSFGDRVVVDVSGDVTEQDRGGEERLADAAVAVRAISAKVRGEHRVPSVHAVDVEQVGGHEPPGAEARGADSAELQRLFVIEAAKYNVLPLDDRAVERVNPDTAGRPTLVHGTTQLLFDGMIGIQENCMLNLKNKSHSVTAEVDVPDNGATGVIINEGGVTGGWAFYFDRGGRLAFTYDWAGLEVTRVGSESAVAAGEHQVRMEFTYDGGGVGKGGAITIFVDGDEVGSGRVEHTHAYNYTLCETGGVGRDVGSPVCDDYAPMDNLFTGSIGWVRLDADDESHDHMLDPIQRLHIAITKQ